MELPRQSGAGLTAGPCSGRLRRQRTGRSAHPENDPAGSALLFCNRHGATATKPFATETPSGQARALGARKRVLWVRASACSGCAQARALGARKRVLWVRASACSGCAQARALGARNFRSASGRNGCREAATAWIAAPYMELPRQSGAGLTAGPCSWPPAAAADRKVRLPANDPAGSALPLCNRHGLTATKPLAAETPLRASACSGCADLPVRFRENGRREAATAWIAAPSMEPPRQSGAGLTAGPCSWPPAAAADRKVRPTLRTAPPGARFRSATVTASLRPSRLRQGRRRPAARPGPEEGVPGAVGKRRPTPSHGLPRNRPQRASNLHPSGRRERPLGPPPPVPAGRVPPTPERARRCGC